MTAKEHGGGEATDIKPLCCTVDFGYVAELGNQLARAPMIGLRYIQQKARHLGRRRAFCCLITTYY
ncbi:MAG TPA: hypothetical protein VF598_14150 [Hymenobacter sp.]